MPARLLCILCIFTILFLVFVPYSNAIYYDETYSRIYCNDYYPKSLSCPGYYNFNFTSTNRTQDWTCDAQGFFYIEHFPGIRVPHEAFSSYRVSRIWNDENNYPNAPFSDPIGNSRGSINISSSFLTYWFDRVDFRVDYVVACFNSPDLSAIDAWQDMDGFSCQILNSGSNSTYTRLYVVLEDQDGNERQFYNSREFSNNPGGWKRHTIANLSDLVDAADPPITRYTVKNVKVEVRIPDPSWGALAGTICLDNVFPQHEY